MEQANTYNRLEIRTKTAIIDPRDGYLKTIFYFKRKEENMYYDDGEDPVMIINDDDIEDDNTPIVINYEAEVHRLIRQKYSQSKEFAILRQKDEKPEEFQEYFDYCEECKAIIRGYMNE